MNNDVVLHLQVIAAKAAQLAVEQQCNRLSPGELEKGLQELREALAKAEHEARIER